MPAPDETTGMKQPLEKRWNARYPVQTEVILHSPLLGVIRTNTRDLSYGGMRLATRCANLVPNCHVRVSFVIRQDAEVRHLSVETRVMHTDSNNHGCGLMLVDFNRDTFLLLHTLMIAGQPADRLLDPLAAQGTNLLQSPESTRLSGFSRVVS